MSDEGLTYAVAILLMTLALILIAWLDHSDDEAGR